MDQKFLIYILLLLLTQLTYFSFNYYDYNHKKKNPIRSKKLSDIQTKVHYIYDRIINFVIIFM